MPGVATRTSGDDEREAAEIANAIGTPPSVAAPSNVAGATAPPRNPAKVWIENARPIFSPRMPADRSA